MTQYANYKVHLNTISNGELSDPLCDSVNRGLTLVRLQQFLPPVGNLRYICWGSDINYHSEKSIVVDRKRRMEIDKPNIHMAIFAMIYFVESGSAGY